MMKYRALKEKLIEIKDSGGLKDNISLDRSIVVVNGSKFVEVQMKLLDKLESDSVSSEIEIHKIMPAFNRLLKYYEKIKDKK